MVGFALFVDVLAAAGQKAAKQWSFVWVAVPAVGAIIAVLSVSRVISD